MGSLQETGLAAIATPDASMGSISYEQVVAGPYGQLAARIIVELERPIFLPMGPDVPYGMSDLSRVMGLADNQTVVVWMKRPGEARRLAAYNTGTPYRSYPEDLLLKVDNVTPVAGGPPLPMPDQSTWMHDTIAVTPSEQGRGIGKTLLDFMIRNASEKGYTSWAVFLSRHFDSKSQEMYNAHPFFSDIQKRGGLVEGVVPHRGTIVTYRLYDLRVSKPFPVH